MSRWELYKAYNIQHEDLPMWGRIEQEWWWGKGPRAERRDEDAMIEAILEVKRRKAKGEFKQPWCQNKDTFDPPGAETMTWRERRRARRQEKWYYRRAFGDHPNFNVFEPNRRVYSALIVVEDNGVDEHGKINCYGFEYKVLWCGDPDAISNDNWLPELWWNLEWNVPGIPQEELDPGDILWIHCIETWDNGSYEYPNDIDGTIFVVGARHWGAVPSEIRERIIPWPKKKEKSTSPTLTVQLNDLFGTSEGSSSSPPSSG